MQGIERISQDMTFTMSGEENIRNISVTSRAVEDGLFQTTQALSTAPQGDRYYNKGRSVSKLVTSMDDMEGLDEFGSETKDVVFEAGNEVDMDTSVNKVLFDDLKNGDLKVHPEYMEVGDCAMDALDYKNATNDMEVNNDVKNDKNETENQGCQAT
jgi:hypothetical protein